MKGNKIVKLVALLLLSLVVFIGLKKCSGQGAATHYEAVVAGGESLSREALVGLGIEGDTEKDVVATLIGTVRGLKSDIGVLRDENQSLRGDNADLQKMENTIERRLMGKLEETATAVRAQTEGKYNAILGRLQQSETDSLMRERSGGAGGYTSTGEVINAGETVWIQPLGREGEGDAGTTGIFTDLRNDTSKKIGLDKLPGVRRRKNYEEDSMRAFYTIPKNATLVNSTALTALVGRVPVGSQVTDPYTFKVIIGRDNLMANGIELPEVAYSVASGKAVGDWTLGCVRGDVYSITFVFEDGTIRTVPKAKDIYEGQASSQEIKIGELSDAFGNPCVVGERITNAYSYLTQRIGVTAASAAAEAAAASQTTVLTTSGGGGVGSSVVVDGSTGQYILGKTIADGMLEVAQWLDQRQSQQFDAIYVPPGRAVSLHITEQIDIDYDALGRKTNHSGAYAGGYRGLD